MSLRPPTEGTPSTATFESRISSVESGSAFKAVNETITGAWVYKAAPRVHGATYTDEVDFVGTDANDAMFQIRLNGAGRLLHLTAGSSAPSASYLIALGMDNAASGILIANKATGKGIYLDQQATVSVNTANALYGAQSNATAALMYLEQKVNTAAEVLKLVNTATTPDAGSRLLSLYSTFIGGEFGWVDASTGDFNYSKAVKISTAGSLSVGGSASFGDATHTNGVTIYGKVDHRLGVSAPATIQEWRTNDGTGILARVNSDGGAEFAQNGGAAATVGVGVAGSRARMYYNNGIAQFDDGGNNKPVALITNGATRIKIDSTGIGFFAATPVAKPTLAAAATDPATTQTLANDIRAKLISYGLAA